MVPGSFLWMKGWLVVRSQMWSIYQKNCWDRNIKCPIIPWLVAISQTFHRTQACVSRKKYKYQVYTLLYFYLFIYAQLCSCQFKFFVATFFCFSNSLPTLMLCHPWPQAPLSSVILFIGLLSICCSFTLMMLIEWRSKLEAGEAFSHFFLIL